MDARRFPWMKGRPPLGPGMGPCLLGKHWVHKVTLMSYGLGRHAEVLVKSRGQRVGSANSPGYGLDAELGSVLHCPHHLGGSLRPLQASPTCFPKKRVGSAVSLQLPLEVPGTEDTKFQDLCITRSHCASPSQFRTSRGLGWR